MILLYIEQLCLEQSLDDINSSFSSRAVSNVPFPRTSGARFCAVGMK